MNSLNWTTITVIVQVALTLHSFTLCNALHDFFTLYVKRSREKWRLLACTTEKTKEKVKSNLDLPLYLEVIEIDQECEYRICANITAPFYFPSRVFW